MHELNKHIAKFYNTSTQLWLDVWGEHMHQGFYGKNGDEKKDHQQAQIDLITELIKWGHVKEANYILDAGCGVGGSARYFSKKFGAAVKGYTLSHIQAVKAKEFNLKSGLDNKIEIIEDDMLSLAPGQKKFDLIWSLESAEHISDKAGLLKLFYESLQPAGKLIIATWCVRPVPPDLSEKEKIIIRHVQHNYHLPPMLSIDEFKTMAVAAGFKNVVAEDWSKAVVPFWNAVYSSALKLKSIAGLLKAGWPAIKGAYTIRYMQKGYRKGTIQFGVLKAEK